MKKGLKELFETYKAKADALLQQKQIVLDHLNNALQKLAEKSPRAKNFFDDLKDFIQMITFWVEGKYEELPYKSAVLVFGAILYFLNPFDLIPDVIPGLGFTDDAAVIGFVVKSVSDDLQKFRLWKRQMGLI